MFNVNKTNPTIQSSTDASKRSTTNNIPNKPTFSRQFPPGDSTPGLGSLKNTVAKFFSRERPVQGPSLPHAHIQEYWRMQEQLKQEFEQQRLQLMQQQDILRQNVKSEDIMAWCQDNPGKTHVSFNSNAEALRNTYL